MRDTSDCIRALLYSYYTTITGWGGPSKVYPHISHPQVGNSWKSWDLVMVLGNSIFYLVKGGYAPEPEKITLWPLL